MRSTRIKILARHCKIKTKSIINRYDPCISSLKKAKERLAEIKTSTNHDIHFTSNLGDTHKAFDLAIISCTSTDRSKIIKKIQKLYEIKYWVIEKLLAQNVEQLDDINKTINNRNGAWVNTPRRLMSWHQEIRSLLRSTSPAPLKVNVSGGSWGLACNAIHYIDLVAWWSEASVQSVNTSGLGDCVQSKRVGFHEICGSLRVFYADGSELELCCHSGSEPFEISVVSPQGEWLIEESAGRGIGPDGQQLQGQLEFQSCLTAPLVIQILEKGYCALPTLEESTSLHRPLLASLLKHWNESHGCQDSTVPIT